MKTDHAGIDYSFGKSNVDNNWIHYGVINQSEVLQAWADSNEPYYWYICPNCTADIGEAYLNTCLACDYEMQDEDFDFMEPMGFLYNGDGYVAQQTSGNTDIFILKSPYYTYAQYCSPCAPGAGYLMNWTDPGVGPKTYCFGHDWFKSGKAPYPVYDVKTDKRIK